MSKAIFWFRQDLRLEDNPGLFQACTNHSEIILLYIQDTPISELKKTAQSWWLHHSLNQLSQSLATHKLHLCLKIGNPEDIFKDIFQHHQIDAVYWNRCYEPQHIQRDQHLKTWLKQLGIQAQSYNSQLLNEPWEVKNQQGGFFKVFTPYWKQCLKQLQIQHPIQINHWPTPIDYFGDHLDEWQLLPNKPNWAIEFDMLWQPGEQGAEARLKNFIQHKLCIYKNGRDFPALQATSNLSPHLHFGEISPWKIYRKVSSYLLEHLEHDDQIKHFLSELGWREFSYHLLFHFPTLASENFKSNFNRFPWHKDDAAFLRWKKGQTGYPIVDAGMRELWYTGTMHNRVRMIVASFLVKDLFIDWREGAEWFNLTLLDADMASNYASWQWVAGSGADAAPYFRIFNPVLQGEKFDPEGIYIRKWVKELEKLPNKWIHHPWDAPSHQLPITLGLHYPHPIVNHNQARDQALSYYQKIKDQSLD